MDTLQIICSVSILLNLFFISGLFFAKDTIKRLRNSNDYFVIRNNFLDKEFFRITNLFENQKKITNRYKSRLNRKIKRIANLELKLESCKK